MSDNLRFAKARNGSMFVWSDAPSGQLFFSPDGRVFFTMQRLGFGDGRISFSDPHNVLKLGGHGSFTLDIKTTPVQFHLKEYFFVIPVEMKTVVPIPDIREPHLLFRARGFVSDDLGNMPYFYLSVSKYGPKAGKPKLFVGESLEELIEIPVSRIAPSHGYPTVYFTQYGNLYVNPSGHSNWDGDELSGLPTIGYVATEVEEKVWIRRK